MSKASELRILRGARSIDAPKQYHHRTGDSEGDGGSMLDSYVQVEESYFEDEEEAAKAAFLKGFQGYLEKVFEGNERKFLRRLMKGQGKPHEIGRALGVDWFECLQSIQRKAFENVEPLQRLSALTGWSRAEEFTTSILRKVSKYANGATDYAQANRNKLRESLKKEGAERQAEQKNKNAACMSAFHAAHREERNAYFRAKYAENPEKARKNQKLWREANIEQYRAREREYYTAHREEIIAKKRAYQAAHKEELAAKRKAYKAAHKEELAAKRKAYKAAYREELNAKKRAYKAANRVYDRVYKAAHREELNAKKRAYYAAHREELNAKKRAKRAAEKAAKAAALAAATLATSESCAATT